MLTNTVILLLRELLPLCILFSFIMALTPQLFANRIFNICFALSCIVVPFLSFTVAEAVSDALEGQGAEVMGVMLLLIFFACLSTATLFSLPKAKTAMCMFIGAIAFITYKGSSLILYLDIYSRQVANWQPLVVGIFIGLGICISLLVLFTFLLSELQSHRQRHWLLLVWLLFLAGNTAESSNLLLQINAVEWGAYAMFDVSAYVQDASEYGHLLNALIGFDTSPTLLFVTIYLMCFSITCLMMLANRVMKNTNKIRPLPSSLGVDL
jgi:high-affinity iron transporter